jgi:hypothetical protein
MFRVPDRASSPPSRPVLEPLDRLKPGRAGNFALPASLEFPAGADFHGCVGGLNPLAGKAKFPARPGISQYRLKYRIFLPIVNKEVSMGSAKQGYILILFFLSLLSPVFAVNISFLVIETGVREESPVNDASILWETTLMDMFFDEGYIVSNAPIMGLPRLPDKEFPDEARGSLEEAIQGGADFFVLALLDYQGALAANSLPIKPQGVLLRLFSVRPYKFLFEQPFSPRPPAPGKDELSDIKSTIRMIIPHIGDRQ